MKRNFLITTAILFVCSIAMLVSAKTVFENTNSVPANSEKRYVFTLPKRKPLFPFKRRKPYGIRASQEDALSPLQRPSQSRL